MTILLNEYITNPLTSLEYFVTMILYEVIHFSQFQRFSQQWIKNGR